MLPFKYTTTSATSYILNGGWASILFSCFLDATRITTGITFYSRAFGDLIAKSTKSMTSIVNAPNMLDGSFSALAFSAVVVFIWFLLILLYRKPGVVSNVVGVDQTWLKLFGHTGVPQNYLLENIDDYNIFFFLFFRVHNGQ